MNLETNKMKSYSRSWNPEPDDYQDQKISTFEKYRKEVDRILTNLNSNSLKIEDKQDLKDELLLKIANFKLKP